MISIKHRYDIEMLWKKYKYEVMWHDQNSYNRIRKMMKDKYEYYEVRDMIHSALLIEPSKGSVVNAFSHVWGYFKKICEPSEKELFKKLKEQYVLDQVETTTLIYFIYCMAMFYDVTYLKDSSLIKNFKIKIAN
ncbi:YbgA family protein [Staphylococcus nepalensis]|nr:YbgA family protein [Staphylococcus nepalensis]